jgi:hypothetical protein
MGWIVGELNVEEEEEAGGFMYGKRCVKVDSSGTSERLPIRDRRKEQKDKPPAYVRRRAH